MSANTIALFDKYYRCLDTIKAPGFNRDLGCEVRERLLQLSYIVDRVHDLERISNEALSRSEAAFTAHVENIKRRGMDYESEPVPESAKITKEEFEKDEKASFEMKLLTEAFYYIAFRVRQILRNSQKPLPGLNSFECKGVRNVRNKLLEHAEGKDSKISIQSFGWGAACGPVLKSIRHAGQEHIFPDQGLYTNAKEFCENLERLLQKVLDKPPKPV